MMSRSGRRSSGVPPLKRIGDPADIAQTVLFLVEGSDFITGQVVVVDGGRSIL
ncbi:MAG: SDR family oxidoreductase [Candidatus Methylomirabilis sp.]|nr:SDR family oxidoreductase [Candidatus Methylomirabilis sp.]